MENTFNGSPAQLLQNDPHKKKMPLIMTYNSDEEDDDDLEDSRPLVRS